ncbi:kinase-like domain-containing protein [Pavlovales sp. CCMP2436]|nr:kinase-like domain-containing protein [Pavlovales sp. CCMP2436]
MAAVKAQQPVRKNVSERWVDGKLHVGNYEVIGKLGEGTFGMVLKAVHVHVGETVAIKVLEKSRINTADEIERVGREVQILKTVHHANVVRLWELLYTRDKIYLVMEFSAAGELFGHIVKRGRLKDDEARFYFRQVVEGLHYLHGLDVVHRDIKPENLLIDHTRRVKIVDFGLSARCTSGGFLKTACGSPCYAAPEMLTRETRQGYEGHPVDVWSLGVTLFAMLCGYLPFEHAQTAQLYKKIIAGEFKSPNFLSADAKDLLRRMLCTDPKKRFTLEQIRKHPWIWRGANGAKPIGPSLQHSYTLAALEDGRAGGEIQLDIIDSLVRRGFERQWSRSSGRTSSGPRRAARNTRRGSRACRAPPTARPEVPPSSPRAPRAAFCRQAAARAARGPRRPSPARRSAALQARATRRTSHRTRATLTRESAAIPAGSRGTTGRPIFPCPRSRPLPPCTRRRTPACTSPATLPAAGRGGRRPPSLRATGGMPCPFFLLFPSSLSRFSSFTFLAYNKNNQKLSPTCSPKARGHDLHSLPFRSLLDVLLPLTLNNVLPCYYL